MPFWRRKPADNPEQPQQGNQARPAAAQTPEIEALDRQAADLKALAGGGIPTTAKARLKALKSEMAAGGSFNSDLSPSETALLHHGGYTPLGLVGGSAMYHVGVQRGFTARDGELGPTSSAYNHATELAVARMGKEANALRAHGVVGVHLTRRVEEFELESETSPEKHHHMLTLSIIGTAVRYVPGETTTPARARMVLSLRTGNLEPAFRVSAPEAVVE